MAAPINLANNLEVLDPPILDQTNFGPDMDRWLSNIVDIINASFMSINTSLTTLNNAFANLLAVGTIDIGGSGMGPLPVNVLGLTASGFVSVNLLSSSLPVTISNVTPGTNQFTVTFSGNPGASAIIQYSAFTAAP